MEHILNAAWLIVAVASYVLHVRCLAGRGPEYAHGPGRLRSVVALSCALAILFPVISLSDDLQEMQAAVIEVSPSRLVIKKSGSSDASNLGKKLHQISFIGSPFILGFGWVILGGSAAQQTAESDASLHLTTPGRAPPSFAVIQAS